MGSSKIIGGSRERRAEVGDAAASGLHIISKPTDVRIAGSSTLLGHYKVAGVTGAIGAGAYPALAGNANLETPDYPIYLIINGQKAMPPVGDVMDDAQIAAVVNYIRHNLGNNFEGESTAEDVAAAR